jgi:hypothetical protein
MKKKIAFVCVMSSIMLFSACGTLFKPVPKASTPGNKLDVSVVVVDSVLLLLGILPGVFAFIVDYKTGALYVNGSKASFTLNDLSDENVQKVLESQGIKVDLDVIKNGREQYFAQQKISIKA